MTSTHAALTHDTPVGTTPVGRAEPAQRVGGVRPWSSAARTAVALGLALGLHGLAFLATSGLPCGFSHGPRLRAELDPAAVVIPLETLPEPAAPEPEPDAPAAAPRIATARAAAPSPSPAPQPTPAPSAPTEPADFTSLAGAFQGATSYAMASSRAVVGAVSGALGRGHAGSGVAGGTGAGSGPAGATGTGGAAVNAQPAQAPRAVNSDWTCPWPGAAIAADLYQQNVTVRVQVGVDGAVERATARDPGFGFGPAAAACARRERFHPARDGAGQPVRATALVRVHFER
ncbi:MAG: hypothetical protein KC668_21095 [Myxococcales bacterium]|nr:hypothetical protein [Myxococcales bacterium]